MTSLAYGLEWVCLTSVILALVVSALETYTGLSLFAELMKSIGWMLGHFDRVKRNRLLMNMIIEVERENRLMHRSSFPIPIGTGKCIGYLRNSVDSDNRREECESD